MQIELHTLDCSVEIEIELSGRVANVSVMPTERK